MCWRTTWVAAKPRQRKGDILSQLKVTLKNSTIGRQRRQLETIKGLGLRKIGHSKVLENTPAVRGMVKKVIHLVSVEEID